MNHVYDDGGVYIPNLSNCAEQYGISQYRFPHNFELAGKDLSITAADKKYTLSFKCRKNLEFDGSKYAYECLKFGPELYFVLFGLSVAVIDLDKCLATLIIGDEYVHGSIDCPDKECKCGCSAVHGCAGDEMVGTKVAWVLGCGRFTTQDFFEQGKCRVAWSPLEDKDYEQTCKATKLGGPYYIVDTKGRVRRGVCAPFFTERVIMLQDYERMMTVGVVMGKGFDPILISGYAKFLN